MPRKFQVSGKSKFDGSEKGLYFLKISKWQHKLVWKYKQGKFVYFLNNAARNMFIWAKILENIDVKMDGSALEEKSSLKMLGLTFSSKLVLGSSVILVAKTASKKIEALIRSMNFLSPEVALYPCKSTIRPCMEYCFHVRAGASSYFVEL